MVAGDWKGLESDWDKDEEMKCSTCAPLHCEKLSALSKHHVPSNWGRILTPGGTISVADARSQNGRQSALMAFARGREVHLQLQPLNDMEACHWPDGGDIRGAIGKSFRSLVPTPHQSNRTSINLSLLKASPQSGLCLTGYTTRFSSFWRCYVVRFNSQCDFAGQARAAPSPSSVGSDL